MTVRGQDRSPNRSVALQRVLREQSASIEPILDVIAVGESASAGQTEVVLDVGGMAMGSLLPGVPAVDAMIPDRVAVSWMSDNAPSGDWSLTLQRRRGGDAAFTDLATVNITTS